MEGLTSTSSKVGGLLAAELGGESLIGRGGFKLASPAFPEGGQLDPCFTAQEEDAVAPPLEWTSPPTGAMELALVVESPRGDGGEPACHWLVWGLASQQGKLLEGEVPPRVGKNSLGNSEWLLPNPPEGAGPQSFIFQLFALDLPLILMPGATRQDLRNAMEGHVVSIALLSASYEHQDMDDGSDWPDEDGQN
jgi:hypothetical protein